MPDRRIRLGAVGTRSKALRALTGGGDAYISETFLTPFAKKRPEDYLLCLEAAAKMIRQGPSFCLDGKHGVLMLAGVDIHHKEGSGFRLAVASATLTREPNGKDWALTSLDFHKGPIIPANPTQDGIIGGGA